MDEGQSFVKTEAGRDEMRTRARHLPGALRQALLLVDGHRTLGQLREMLAGSKAPTDCVEQILALGLIEPVSPPEPPAPAPPPSPAPSAPIPLAESTEPSRSAFPDSSPGEAAPRIVDRRAPVRERTVEEVSAEELEAKRFERLYMLMLEVTRDYLGIRGMFMQLKIERCANVDDLLALRYELGEAISRARGPAVAAELVARIQAAA